MIRIKDETKINKDNDTSLWAKLKIKKLEDRTYSITKTFLVFLVIIAVLIFGCGYFIGTKWDINDLINPSAESIQIKIEENIAKDIEKINKELKDEYKLDKKATYYTNGSVSGHNYYQYYSYAKDENTYVAWIIDSDTKEVLSVWVAEQHKTESESISKKIFTKIIDDLYKDKVSNTNRTKIKEYMDKSSEEYINDENFAYLQQYSTENLEDGYDYVVLYEVDFFKYIPENAVVDDSVVVEDESVE